MNSFDLFCNDLLEQSKRFNEKRKSEKDSEGKKAYQNASLLLAICALEAYINGISEEITIARDFPIHEKGVLLEQDVKLKRGEWVLSNGLKMSRLTDRIELLYKRHALKKLDGKEEPWWQILQDGIDYRNKITHPKEDVAFPEDFIDKVIESVIECISKLYQAVYKRHFPKSNLSLISKFEF